MVVEITTRVGSINFVETEAIHFIACDAINFMPCNGMVHGRMFLYGLDDSGQRDLFDFIRPYRFNNGIKWTGLYLDFPECKLHSGSNGYITNIKINGKEYFNADNQRNA